MDALHIEDIPTLRRPYLLMTFDGWSNAAGVATAAGHFLVQHLQAERFAWIDPEEFFSFTDSGHIYQPRRGANQTLRRIPDLYAGGALGRCPVFGTRALLGLGD